MRVGTLINHVLARHRKSTKTCNSAWHVNAVRHSMVLPQNCMLGPLGTLRHCDGAQVVVEFGSTWCTHCEEMFPHFLRLSRQVLRPLNLSVWAVSSSVAGGLRHAAGLWMISSAVAASGVCALRGHIHRTSTSSQPGGLHAGRGEGAVRCRVMCFWLWGAGLCSTNLLLCKATQTHFLKTAAFEARL